MGSTEVERVVVVGVTDEMDFAFNMGVRKSCNDRQEPQETVVIMFQGSIIRVTTAKKNHVGPID